ncbi:FecR domain-containing protein [Novosphingobium sp. BL-8A]|uniref:FecR family protein n=1 Tax=Novosphingobium sp. BL-8A TaxID=3127639 RepID=UPI0037564312
MPSIDDIASAWALRCDAGALDVAEQTELDSWLDADRRHRGAFVRAQAVLNWLDAAPNTQAVSNTQPAPEVADPMEQHARPRRRWMRMAGLGTLTAMAASLALFLLVPSAPDYATEIGEQRQVTLDDGSIAALNTDSQLDVAYSDARRDLTLRGGEAWFKVAHNRARPFEVRVGKVHVRATGTAFSVRRIDRGVRVVVSEGRVLAWVEGSPQPPIAISRGDEAVLRPDLAVQHAAVTVDVDQALAWRRGEIGLDGQSGAEAAAEFNRYSTRPIRVVNPRAAQYRLVGYFQTSQSQEFALALAKLTHSQVSQKGNEIIIE